MMKKILLVPTLLFFGLSLKIQAQTPDWSSEVASIIYNNCSSCHHEGGIGPFALMTYQDAVDNAFNIQSFVTAGKMPPWPPDPDCSYEIIGDRRLSDEDINTINEWVNGGMPSGDLATAPLPPEFTANATALDGIDQTVSLPHYTVQLATDEYRTFVVHSEFATAQYINQLEVIPGNSAIVHHVIMYYDPTSSSYDVDMMDSLPGFATNGANPPTTSCVMVGGWAPGAQAQKLPANMAYQVPANSDFVIEVHYAPGHQGEEDSTKVNLKFCTQASPRLVSVQPLLFHYWPSLVNGPLVIPANTVKTFYEKSVGFTFDANGNYSLLSVAPHMHLIGKSWSVYLTSPTNDTTRLICIPDWNFHWQLGYMFHNLIQFNSGGGYRLGAAATYDNTTNNPNNPNNPPVTISLGESTLDEMMVVFFAYLDYQAGDENIILDEATGIEEATNPAMPISLYPNPAKDEVELSAIVSAGDLQIQILNTTGAVVKSFEKGLQPQGAYATRLNISDIPSGIYLLQLSSGEIHSMSKMVKMD